MKKMNYSTEVMIIIIIIIIITTTIIVIGIMIIIIVILITIIIIIAKETQRNKLRNWLGNVKGWNWFWGNSQRNWILLWRTKSEFFEICSSLNLNRKIQILLTFYPVILDHKSLENKLSIHIETGNIFYDNYNRGESIYKLLTRQQEDTKQKK